MYKIKEGKKKEIKKIINSKDIANIIGVTEGYISQIMNARKLNISKTVAYAITKAIDNNKEITDFFDII